MLRGKTKSGFEFEIADTSLDNMELLDLLGEIDDGKMSCVSKAAVLLLGKEQKERLYDHLRTEKGNVPINNFFDTLKEILSVNVETKNS